MKFNKKAFTLVETMIVIAIIAILAGVAFIGMRGAIEMGKDAAVIASLGKIQTESGIQRLAGRTILFTGAYQNNTIAATVATIERELVGVGNFPIISAEPAYIPPTGALFYETTDARNWCAWVELHDGRYWCTDAVGHNGEVFRNYDPDDAGPLPITIHCGLARFRCQPAVLVAPPDRTLTVTRTGTGIGTVVSPVPPEAATAINCGEDCTHTVAPGTLITLRAIPAAGYFFGGWTDDACRPFGTGDCTVIMNEAKTVTASFLSPWVDVPPNPDLGTAAFQVMKFEAKNVGGVATSQPEGTPWVEIDQDEAREACMAIGARLMTNNEWVALARNIESVGWNWNGGVAGVNQMSDGHSDSPSTPPDALAVTDMNDHCCGTGQTCPGDTWNSQRRTYRLTNGQYIWDLGGNVWERVNDLNTPAVRALGRGNLLTTNDHLCTSTIASNGVFLSGDWHFVAGAGAFALFPGFAPTGVCTGLGFRCAR